MTFPRTTAALKEALSAHGLRPQQKKHGQCFLTDPQAVDAVVRDAGVRSADHVVEVGTGSGLLTHALCETGAAVTTFDVDADIQALAQALRTWPERVTFVQGDVLEQKHVLSEAFRGAIARPPREAGGRRLLVSNLPYNVATPILLGLLSLEAPPEEIVAMIQREVAEKMLAKPGTPNFGVPSIHVGLKAEGRILRRFGPSVFWPRPKVDSAVIGLVPRPGRIEPDAQRPFADFVTALYTRRRKVLPTGLAHAAGLPVAQARAIVEAEGFAPTVRVQELGPEAVLALYRRIREV